MAHEHLIWIDQCAAARELREERGARQALGYLVGEKLLNFLRAAETRPEFAAQVPSFVAEIRELFEPHELVAYLDSAKRIGALGHMHTVLREHGALEESPIEAAADQGDADGGGARRRFVIVLLRHLTRATTAGLSLALLACSMLPQETITQVPESRAVDRNTAEALVSRMEAAAEHPADPTRQLKTLEILSSLHGLSSDHHERLANVRSRLAAAETSRPHMGDEADVSDGVRRLGSSAPIIGRTRVVGFGRAQHRRWPSPIYVSDSWLHLRGSSLGLWRAENGDLRGRDNDWDGRSEPVHVQGHYRSDGTYVRGHYRAKRSD